MDFEVLRQLLGNEIDEREEKYGLNWHGKRQARRIALTPSRMMSPRSTLIRCQSPPLGQPTSHRCTRTRRQHHKSLYTARLPAGIRTSHTPTVPRGSLASL